MATRQKFLRECVNAYIAGGTIAAKTLKALLLKDVGSALVDNKDDQFVSTVLARAENDEATAAGYARQSLANVAISIDDTNDRTELKADKTVWSGITAGETYRGVLVYVDDAGGDGARVVIGIYVFASPPSGVTSVEVRWDNIDGNGTLWRNAA